MSPRIIINSLTPEQAERLWSAMPVVDRIADRYGRMLYGTFDEDVHNVALRGAMIATVTYRPEKGQWSYWLKRRVRGTICSWITVYVRRREHATPQNEVEAWRCPNRDPSEVAESDDSYQRMLDLIPDKKERAVVDLITREGQTYAGAARIVGTTPNAAWRLYRQAIACLGDSIAARERLINNNTPQT